MLFPLSPLRELGCPNKRNLLIFLIILSVCLCRWNYYLTFNIIRPSVYVSKYWSYFALSYIIMSVGNRKIHCAMWSNPNRYKVLQTRTLRNNIWHVFSTPHYLYVSHHKQPCLLTTPGIMISIKTSLMLVRWYFSQAEKT